MHGKQRQVDSMFRKTEGKLTVCLERTKETRECSWKEQIYIIRHCVCGKTKGKLVV
jgi:hypothetical protein